jgi:aminopeptidase
MNVDVLWQVVFQAMRVIGPPDSAVSGQNAYSASNPVELWHTHLSNLARRRDELNAARHRHIRYVGEGTDLTLDLTRSHAWCTAQLTSRSGVIFVCNLPTEEIFTAPHKKSARGNVRIARPITHGGTVIEGIELEFRRGRVVSARSRTGQDALQHLLATDHSSDRIGEVAILPALLEDSSPTERDPSGDKSSTWQASARLFHHTLLDENAANHIALGDAYPFCSRAFIPLALNSSQIHLDLPLDASVEFTR